MSFEIKNPKFRPGPWKVYRRGPCGPAQESFWVGQGETEWRGPSSIVDICEGSAHKDEVEATAALIAAAPEMFDMLCAVHLLLENVVCGHAREDIEKVIKKARGEL